MGLIKVGQTVQIQNPYISDKSNIIYDITLLRWKGERRYIVFGNIEARGLAEKLCEGTLADCRKYCRRYV